MNAPRTLREKIAQLIFVRIGSNMPPLTTAAEDQRRIEGLIDHTLIGGLLLFNGGAAAACADTLQSLQRRAAFPLMVATDMERGSGQQITDHTLWPHSMAFNALGDDAAVAVERFAYLSAIQAREIGVHVSLSPVADVHRNPNNPIIATRAFGCTANRAAELSLAYVEGCHHAGLLCCGKHFPGHGNTAQDSHDELPIVGESREQLEETDLLPFKRLIQCGVDMMMTAHVAYPALDDSKTPATLSRPILTDLLRNEWGYQGAVASDSFKMEGVRVGSEAEITIAAVKAGVDLLLDITDVEGVIDAIERACQSDEQLTQRIDEAFGRLWQMKQRACQSPIDITVAPSEANAHAQMVARRALTITANNGRLMTPVSADSRVLTVLINPFGDGAYTHTSALVDAWQSHRSVTKTHVVTCEPNADQTQSLLEDAEQADCALTAIVVKPAAWQDFGMSSNLIDLVQQLTSRCPTAIASLGVAEILEDYPQAAVRLTTFSDVTASQKALLDWFFG